MCVLAARGAGRLRIVAVDIETKGLEVAKRAGVRAVHVVGEKAGDAVDADVCIEEIGAEKELGMSIEKAKSGAFLFSLWVWRGE